MPYKDVTYDNGFTERFYFDETEEEEALENQKIMEVDPTIKNPFEEIDEELKKTKEQNLILAEVKNVIGE